MLFAFSRCLQYCHAVFEGATVRDVGLLPQGGVVLIVRSRAFPLAIGGRRSRPCSADAELNRVSGIPGAQGVHSLCSVFCSLQRRREIQEGKRSVSALQAALAVNRAPWFKRKKLEIK
jgi:hypothetical protein